MKKIYKYEIEGTLELPVGYKILSIQEQHSKIVMWAEIDVYAQKREVNFIVIGTGWEVLKNSEYIETVQIGHFVWHIYRKLESEDGE